MSQLTLLEVAAPAPPEGIDLRCCGVEDLLADMPDRPTLITADPPWIYSQEAFTAQPNRQYSVVDNDQIASWLAAAYQVAAPNARLAVWCTWPKLAEWWAAVEACAAWRWTYKSGGSWHKIPHAGVGYHWLGNSELVLLYTKGSPPATNWGPLSNAHESPRQKHSEKPADWQAQWLDRWTKEGDLVLDLFAGMAPMARACARMKRRYVGAEIDPYRHRAALDRLAIDRSRTW